MKIQLIILLLLLSTYNFYAQNLIIKTIDRGNYNYIPKLAFSDSVGGIEHVDFRLRNVNEKKEFVIYWNSLCTDGSYDLTITPEQIYFSTSHDNPSPNLLFWVIEIDSTQYNCIKNGLINNLPERFINYSYNYDGSYIFLDTSYRENIIIPENWIDEKLEKFDIYCKYLIEKQLKQYTVIFNNYIQCENKSIILPFIIDYEKVKYFYWNRKELQNWIIYSIEQNNNN